MRHLKMLGLAAVAALAVMALVGAGSASASVLCKVKPSAENKCPAGETLPKGTAIEGTSSHAELVNTGKPNVLCEASSVGGTTTSAGSSKENVKGSITTLTFTKCKTTSGTIVSCTVNAQGLPYSAEVLSSAVVGNGTMNVSKGKASVSCGFGILQCVFGAPSLSLAVTGGNPAMVVANEATMTLEKESGFEECPSSSNWNATYTVTNPTALWVAKE